MSADKSALSGFQYSDFAEQHLDVGNVNGSEVMVRCEFHGSSKYTLQFNLQTGLWVCFSCGEGGGIAKLGEQYGVLNVRAMEPDLKRTVQHVQETLRELNRPKKQPSFADDESLQRYAFPTPYWGRCSQDRRPPQGCTGKVGCSFHRWLKQDTVQQFELGYDIINNAATIPARDMEGRLAGVILRYLDPDVDLRYKYPSKKKSPFNRQDYMHGAHLVEQSNSNMVCIVEGSIDTAKVWQAEIPALGQYGSSITPNQVRLLRRLGVGEIVLFYDNDKAGRKAELYAQGIRLRSDHGKQYQEYDPRTDLRREFLVRAVRYDRNPLLSNDPGGSSSKAIRRAVDSAVRLR